MTISAQRDNLLASGASCAITMEHDVRDTSAVGLITNIASALREITLFRCALMVTESE